MRPLLIWLLFTGFLASATLPSAAQLPTETFAPVVFQARVQERQGKPVAGQAVQLEYGLEGVALQDDGRMEGIFSDGSARVVTDGNGVATLRLSGSPWTHQEQWFRGRTTLTIRILQEPQREIGILDEPPFPTRVQLPAAEKTALPTITLYDAPTMMLDKRFPVWVSSDGKLSQVAVVLTGFDLYNRMSATDIMELLGPAADALREQGLSILIVHFPDSHLTPDLMAPLAAQAIRAAAAASGHQVAVVGLSAGGIVARWALVQAEAQGSPLPVHTYVSVDTPNRGATLSPALQAVTLRYGKREDKAALGSDAAHVLLMAQPKNVQWRWVGLPELGQAVPVSWDADTTAHDAFYNRLRQLNDHNGYPKSCRLIGVSSGSRHGSGGNGGLLTLWVPFDYRWTLPSTPEDHAPGSLLPPYYVSRFSTILPLGIAGAYLKSAPTFIPTESALDAGPEETPPFDVWYARPDHAPPIPHDQVDADEARFIVGQLLACTWPLTP